MRTSSHKDSETVLYAAPRCCQTNANQSQFTAECRNLGGTKQAPLGKGGGTVEFEIVACVESALLFEVVVN